MAPADDCRRAGRGPAVPAAASGLSVIRHRRPETGTRRCHYIGSAVGSRARRPTRSPRTMRDAIELTPSSAPPAESEHALPRRGVVRLAARGPSGPTEDRVALDEDLDGCGAPVLVRAPVPVVRHWAMHPHGADADARPQGVPVVVGLPSDVLSERAR